MYKLLQIYNIFISLRFFLSHSPNEAAHQYVSLTVYRHCSFPLPIKYYSCCDCNK